MNSESNANSCCGNSDYDNADCAGVSCAGVSYSTCAKHENYRDLTLIDEDLSGDIDSAVRNEVIDFRKRCAQYDIDNRVFKLRDDVERECDLVYLPGGNPMHTYDVCWPKSAKKGEKLPVIVEMHGGSFTFGSKEVNRCYASELASGGLVVVSLNYRLMPSVNLAEQISDVTAALKHFSSKIDNFPADPNKIFLAGDSAGATLALYAGLIENNDEMARDFVIDPAGIRVRGFVLVSGFFDMSSFFPADPINDSCKHDLLKIMNICEKYFFEPATRKAVPRWSSLAALAENNHFPPLFIATCSDDFLRADSIRLAAAAIGQGADVELVDEYALPGHPLGHGFALTNPFEPQSLSTIDRIVSFVKRTGSR